MNLSAHADAPRSRRGEAGFTLVEALCAIVILIFGLMAVTNLMLVAASSNTVGNVTTAATDAATRQLETLKATRFGDGTGAPGDLPVLAPGVTVGDVTGADPAFCTVSTTDPFTGQDEYEGVGQIRTCWQLTGIDPYTIFIRVRAEGTGALTGARSRAEFTVFRSCTTSTVGCPP